MKSAHISQRKPEKKTERLINLLLDKEEIKNTRDAGDFIMGIFGWRRTSEWDEYNLNIIKDNEATLENNIKENTKYITEKRSFAIEEKNTVWKKFKCWKKDLTKP